VSGASASATRALLVAHELTLERGGRTLFSALSLAVERGQLLQLEGANGAGKTSLLRVLAGLSRLGFEGRVERPAPLLFLGHQPAVKGLLTARENLCWHPAGAEAGDAASIDEALEAVGLYGCEDLPAHYLSAGQQRRVNLARLYLAQEPLWLLDEPFTAIDRAGVAALEALFERHVGAGGGIVLTSHQPVAVACETRALLLGVAP
jgi:heme exporter protein A